MKQIMSNIMLLTVRTDEWKRNGFSHTFPASTHYLKTDFVIKMMGKQSHLKVVAPCTSLEFPINL